MALNDAHGSSASFTVQIQFQQNSTWQGTVMWMDQKRSQRFRSEIELLELMREAVEYQLAKGEQQAQCGSRDEQADGQ